MGEPACRILSGRVRALQSDRALRIDDLNPVRVLNCSLPDVKNAYEHDKPGNPK